MLTLDEAIKHCEEVAEKQEITAKSYLMETDKTKADGILRVYDYDEYESCMKCKSDHRQLAEWLRELQQRRKYENGCQYCKYKFRSDEDEPCVICSHNYTDKFRDDGTSEVNADEDSD